MMENIAHPKRFIVLLMVLASIGPMALNMPLPSLPAIQTYFGVTADVVQLTLSVYLLGMGASQIIMGPLSDRFGRRPIIIIGMVLGVICSIAAVFAPSIDWLITARFFQAIGATAGVVLGRAMIRDLYTQDKAASMIGYVTMGMMVTPMITPIIGGYLTEVINWKAMFGVIVLLTLLAGIFAYIDLPETRNFKHADRGFAGLLSDAKELVQVKKFWGYCLLGGFSSLTFFMFTGAAPYLMMQEMHLTPKEYGAWIAPIAAGYALGNWVSGKYTVQYGIDTMIKWGAITGIAACILHFVIYFMGLMSQPIWLIIPQALLAAANGLQLPSSMAGALSVKPHISGSAAGVNGCTQMMMGAVAAQATGWLVVQTQSVVPLLSGLLISMILGAICYRVMTRG